MCAVSFTLDAIRVIRDFTEKTSSSEIGKHSTGSVVTNVPQSWQKAWQCAPYASFKVPQAPSSFKPMVF